MVWEVRDITEGKKFKLMSKVPKSMNKYYQSLKVSRESETLLTTALCGVTKLERSHTIDLICELLSEL